MSAVRVQAWRGRAGQERRGAYAEQGIRCNAILPGPTMTGIAGPTPHVDPRRHSPPAAGARAPRAQPEQMASVAVFLASDAASFVNGAIVPVDAAWSAA